MLLIDSWNCDYTYLHLTRNQSDFVIQIANIFCSITAVWKNEITSKCQLLKDKNQYSTVYRTV